MPGPADGLRVTFTLSRLSSQAAMRSAGALLRGATTVAVAMFSPVRGM